MAVWRTRRESRGRPGTTGASSLPTYKPAELARILGIARNGVYAALRSGTHIRIGRRFVIPRTAVNAWFARALQSAVKVGSTERKRLRDRQ
ncbi:MAG: helix-turn-helix domain-containing protein [Terriglobia bacterium]